MSDESHYREQLGRSHRVVVKVGTRLLVDDDGTLNHFRLEQLVESLAGLHQRGLEIVLVSSGAGPAWGDRSAAAGRTPSCSRAASRSR